MSVAKGIPPFSLRLTPRHGRDIREPAEDQKGDEQAGYRDFEKKVIGLVRRYWRTNATGSLDSALGVLIGLNAKAVRHTVSQQQVTSFEGWLGKQGGFAVRTRRLRSMNRGYRITFEKQDRPDVDEELGSAGLASGFSLSAVGPVSLPPFRFGVSDRRGNFCALKASNPVAEQVLELFWPSNAQASSAKTNSPGHTPLGYIDAVTQLPSASRDESTWMAALVNRFPAEVYEVAQHSQDPTRAAAAAALLGDVDLNAEWADRFGMLSGERPSGQRSDLVPLQIWRPLVEGGTDAVATPAPRPVGIKRGDVWVYRNGPEPLPVPDQQWLVLEDATVQDGGTVLARGRLIVYEGSADPSLDFVSGQWDSVFGSAFPPDRALVRLREKSSRRLPEGVLLSGRNDDNWYHWMVEYLPRIFQIDSSVPSSAPFIVSSRTPPSGIAALERFADREIVVVDAALAHEVEQLHVLAPSVQVLDTTRVPWSQGLSMNAAPLLEFRRRLGLGDTGWGRRQTGVPAAHIVATRPDQPAGARRDRESPGPGARRPVWSQLARTDRALLVVVARGRRQRSRHGQLPAHGPRGAGCSPSPPTLSRTSCCPPRSPASAKSRSAISLVRTSLPSRITWHGTDGCTRRSASGPSSSSEQCVMRSRASVDRLRSPAAARIDIRPGTCLEVELVTTALNL